MTNQVKDLSGAEPRGLARLFDNLLKPHLAPVLDWLKALHAQGVAASTTLQDIRKHLDWLKALHTQGVAASTTLQDIRKHLREVHDEILATRNAVHHVQSRRKSPTALERDVVQVGWYCTNFPKTAQQVADEIKQPSDDVKVILRALCATFALRTWREEGRILYQPNSKDVASILRIVVRHAPTGIAFKPLLEEAKDRLEPDNEKEHLQLALDLGPFTRTERGGQTLYSTTPTVLYE